MKQNYKWTREDLQFPKNVKSWFFKMREAYVSEKYIVYVRPIGDDEYHMGIVSVDGSKVGWAEKQKIKNDLFGEDRVAYEVYPKEADKIDEGSVYHLWVVSNNEKQRWNLADESV